MAEQTNSFECDINLGFDITETPRDDLSEHEVKHSAHTGLLFPSGRVWNYMGRSIVNDGANSFDSISPSAAVYLSAVLEFMTSELLQLAGNAAQRKNKARIEPPDIKTAVKDDPEFGIFFKTPESKSRLSVPASPYDDKERERFAHRNNSHLRFWAEADDERDDTVSQPEETPEYGTEHKATDDELDDDSEHDLCILNEIQFIPGLYYIDNYIGAGAQREIVQFVNNNEWNKVSSRIAQQYGCGMQRKPFDEIPLCVRDVLRSIVTDDRLPIPCEYVLDQLMVDNYPSFGGREYHLDSTECFGEYIVIVSLVNEAVMDFKHIESKAVKQIVLKPQSLLILSGHVRYLWEYGITESDVHCIGDDIKIERQQRISLTFRKCIDLEAFNKEYKGNEEHLDIDKWEESEINNAFLCKIDALLNTVDAFME